MHGKSPQIIGVAGASCAGKTWLADRLSAAIGEQAARISLDSFYHDKSHLPAARRARVNFDHPRAIDWARVEETLRDCARQRPFSIPRYDFATHSRQVQDFACAPAPVTIIDGLWLFRRASVRQLLTLKIFVRSNQELCVARRLKRDTHERGRTEEQVREQLARYTLPMQARFVAPQEKWADLILEAPIREEDVSQILNRIAENFCPVGI